MVFAVVNELCGLKGFLRATFAACLMGSGHWTESKVVSMPLTTSTTGSRKALTLHGMSFDLRLDSPSSIPIRYQSLPNVKNQFERGEYEEIIETFLPLARQEELVDSEVLFLLIQALVRNRNNSIAFEVMSLHYDQIIEDKTLLQDYILLSSKEGHYDQMDSAMLRLDDMYGKNGIHSKIMQSMFIARVPQQRIDAYIQKMNEHYGIHAGYEMLRAAYNARSWDIAELLATSVPSSPRNNLLALKTFHRIGNKTKTLNVFSKLRPRDFNQQQKQEIVRIGLKFRNELNLIPWFEEADSELIRLETSRSQFDRGIAENNFDSAMEAFVHLYEVEGASHRQILKLLRTDALMVHKGLDRLYEIGGNDPKMLSFIIEFGEKYRYHGLSAKAFNRLDCMALCSHHNDKLINDYIDGVVNSGNVRMMQELYDQIPYFISNSSKLHDFASLFEQFKHSTFAESNVDDDSDLIEVRLLSQIIRHHTAHVDTKTARRQHALIVNNTLKFGGAERQVIRCLSAKNFTKNFVLWNRNVNTYANSFLESVEEMDVQIFDYSTGSLNEKLPYDGEIEVLLSLIPSTPPFNPGIKTKIRNLVEILRQDQPHTLHLWQDTTNVLGAISGLIAGVPRIVMSARSLPPFACVDSTFPDKGPNYYFNNRFVRELYQLLLSSENVYLCHNSENGRQKYIEWLGGFGEKMPLLRNGFDFPMHLPSRAAGEPNHRVVGAVFRFVEVKRPLLWLDVAKSVFHQHPDVRFKMVGDGPMLETAVNHAQSLGLSDVVEFLGYRDDVDSILPTFDAFLLTSKIEGLPNVLVEAQGFGVPVVSTNAGGAGETFLDGKTGILVTEDSVDSLASAVIRVLNHPSYTSNARTIGREFVINTFSESAMHRDLESILFGVGK